MKTTQIWALIQEWMDAQFFTVTQAQLAQKVGVSRSALSQWKTGQARPKPEHLMELHRVTRIDYDLLVEALVQDLGYRDVKAGGRDASSSTAPNNQAPVRGARKSTVDIASDTVDQPRRADRPGNSG